MRIRGMSKILAVVPPEGGEVMPFELWYRRGRYFFYDCQKQKLILISRDESKELLKAYPHFEVKEK